MHLRASDRRLNRIRERFRNRSLSVLLAVQLLIIFAMGPMLSFDLHVSATVAGSVLLLVIAAVVIAAQSLVPMLAVIAALIFNAAAALALRRPDATVAAYWMDAIGAALSIAGISWVVVKVVFAPGRIDRFRIVGAVVLYLNVALLFENFYRLIIEIAPTSFRGLPDNFDTMRATGELMYFSMTTLTTLGYGDIVPVHPIARSLANLEALIGQLYPAIILARIMTLYRSAE